MADSIDFKMVTLPFTRFVDDRTRRMNRASMWAVRQAGREVRKEARRAAPVLKDKSLASHAQLRRRAKAGENVKAAYDKPVPGLLRASIRPARNLLKLGRGEYRLKVGPRGARTHLYAAKQEERYGYMAKGEAAGQAAIGPIAERAFARVWKEH